MPERNGTIYGYGRASTKIQEASPEVQRGIINDYIRTNRLGKEIDVWFCDPATSGRIPFLERESASSMMSRFHPGDHLVIAKLDRAFRNLGDCIGMMEHLQRIGVKFHVCNLMGGAIDLSTPIGQFLLHILASAAQLERAFIAERIREGLAWRAKRGIKHSKHAGYGFKWERTRKLDNRGRQIKIRVPHEGERACMRRMAMWRMQDRPLSYLQIYKALEEEGAITKDGKPWSLPRIKRAIREEFHLQAKESLGKQ
jgi:DNA invertase Pin-like site-specific DNA recombinase